MEARQLRLLMVEDAESDCFLFRTALEEARVNLTLRSVTDGQEAIEYLLGRGGYRDRREHPLPDLVVLDLRMRRVSGVDFLKWCQEAPECRGIPVVILTGAVAEDGEIQAALAAGAARVYLKPASISSLEEIVREIYELGLRCQDSGRNAASFVAKAA